MLNRVGSAKLVAKVLMEKQPLLRTRRLTGDERGSFPDVKEENEESFVSDAGAAEGTEDDGGVSESVISDLKNAFGTDFHVDKALIDAILRRNCIAFVGAGFSQGETKMTWDDLVEKLLVLLQPCTSSVYSHVLSGYV
jgi:hypothetical protein